MKIRWLLALGILLGIVGASLFVALSVLYLKPYMQVRNMKPTTCSTIDSSSPDTEDHVLCVCTAGSSSSCRSSYRCVRVYVNFTTADGIVVENATLYDEQTTFTLQLNKEQCSFHYCDYPADKNEAEIEKRREKFAHRGTVVPCFYEPSNLTYAIVEIVPLTKVIHALFWPLLAVVLGLVIIAVQICDVCQLAKNTTSTASPFNSLEKPWVRHAERNYEKVKTLSDYQREDDEAFEVHDNE